MNAGFLDFELRIYEGSLVTKGLSSKFLSPSREPFAGVCIQPEKVRN